MRLPIQWFEGMKPFFIGSAVLLVFGVFALLLELQSASFVQWDGIKVHGDTYGGVTTYTYAGQTYSIDDTAISADDLRHIRTTVWLPRDDPNDPERAFIESAWDRWTDFAFLTSWYIAAVLVVVIGMGRGIYRRRRRERRSLVSNFGTGLDPELVQRILAERRRPPRRAV